LMRAAYGGSWSHPTSPLCPSKPPIIALTTSCRSGPIPTVLCDRAKRRQDLAWGDLRRFGRIFDWDVVSEAVRKFGALAPVASLARG